MPLCIGLGPGVQLSQPQRGDAVLLRFGQCCNVRPVPRRNTPATPVQGCLLSIAIQAKGAGQGDGTTEDFDEGYMAHADGLRRIGVDVNVNALLCATASHALVSGMPKRAEPMTPEKAAWAKKVGQRLAWVREIAGASQGKVASLLGIGQQAVSGYEKGIRVPDPHVMLVFCARFQVSMEYVYRGGLAGVHPALAGALLAAHPELRPPANDTGQDTGTALAAYRASIGAG